MEDHVADPILDNHELQQHKLLVIQDRPPAGGAAIIPHHLAPGLHVPEIDNPHDPVQEPAGGVAFVRA